MEPYQELTPDNAEPTLTLAAEQSTASELKVCRLDWLILVCTVLISAGLYLTTFPREFTNWDDPEYIVNNPLIRSLSLQKLNRIITEPYFANYAPLTLLSYALDYSVWQLNPVGYHLHNLLLHLGCVLALFFLLRQFALPRFVILSSIVLVCHSPSERGIG